MCILLWHPKKERIKKEKVGINSFVREGDFVLLSGIKSSNPVPRNTKLALKVTPLLITLYIPTLEAEGSLGV